MIIIEELRGYMEALAIGMWCKGSGQELRQGEAGLAQRALEKDLAGPWQDLQTLAASISGVTIMAAVNELHKRGVANVPPEVLAALLESLPLRVLNEGQIEISEGDEDEPAGPCTTRH